ncbi:MAG: DUF2905 domain-containing protein [Brevinematales bacterium]|nr:DUF2905 domain-containing protein [Brevinematales bacterium]
MSEIGKWLFVTGLLFCLVGGVLFLGGKTGILGWFGKLPGDIHYQGKGVEVYIPWVSMLVVSLLFSLVLQLIALMRK